MLKIVRENESLSALGRLPGGMLRAKLKESFLNAKNALKDTPNIDDMDGQIIDIFDDNDNPFLSLKYVKNTHNHPLLGESAHHLWDYGYEEENLDFTFLNQFNEFVFLEIEEYSFYAIEILLKNFPDKKIKCADNLASILWDNVEYAPSVWKNISRGSCLVYSGKYHDEFGIPVFVGQRQLDMGCHICASYHVMHSLIWMRKRESFGDKHKDKTIFVIDFEPTTRGLIDIVRMAISLTLYAKSRNWTPVIHISRLQNQYLLKEGDNMWEYFFEPVSRVSYEDAMESYNVVQAATNGVEMKDLYTHPVLFQYDQLVGYAMYMADLGYVKSLIRINYDTMHFIRSVVPKEVFEEATLGVIARGTDYSRAAGMKIGVVSTNASPEQMIEASEEYAKKYNCKYIFLATEDENIFRAFKKRFGERLLYVEQKRVAYDYSKKDYKPVSELLDLKDGKTFGRKYLASMYALSRSKVLISSMPCGAWVGALTLAEGYFSEFKIIRHK